MFGLWMYSSVVEARIEAKICRTREFEDEIEAEGADAI
jgi:hypothetical protein